MQLVEMIGNLLTDVDTTLSRSEFTQANSQWQQLYALRNRLDDLQRKLVTLSVNADDESYKAATEQVIAASGSMAADISAPQRIANTIQGVAKVTALMDSFFVGYKEPDPRHKRGR